MQLKILILFLNLLPFFLKAQNLISNPSFEEIMNCPNGDGQIYMVDDWNSMLGMTPDLLHTCAPPSVFGSLFAAPLSRFGYQIPRTGEAYMGISAYRFNFETATNGGYEYMETMLNSSTKEGVSYFIEFYVSPNDIITASGLGFTDGLGLVLTDEKLLPEEEIPEDLIILDPTIIHQGSVIKDTVNWTRIYGSHIATGREKYATIGNFRPQPETIFEIVEPEGLQRSYYFIDDVAILPYDPLPDTLVLLCSGETLSLDGSFIHATDYLWNTGQTDAEIIITEGGKYSITAYVDTVRLYDETEIILIDEEVAVWQQDTTICQGSSLSLTSPFPGDYIWTTGDTTATISVTDADTYSVIVDNACGEYEFTVDLDLLECDCQVYVPNAFSPDDDGVNDRMETYFACPLEYSVVQFSVFDRWGNQLYFSENEAEWDGTKEGEELDAGEYVWFLEYEYYNLDTDSFESRLEKGSVVIVR